MSRYEYTTEILVPVKATISFDINGDMEIKNLEIDREDYTDEEFLENNEAEIIKQIRDDIQGF